MESDWEASIYGLPMARVPLVFTTTPDDVVGARITARGLLEAAGAAIEEMGARHCSVLVQSEETGVIHALCDAGWRMVDSTLDFTWECGRTNPGKVDSRVKLRASAEQDRDPLVQLAREAYTHSIRTRFGSDPWLPVEKTGELYARWLELACDGEFADVVVVAEVDGRPVGFNTFKLDSRLTEATGVGFGAHGIAAVAPEYRGLAGQPAMLHWLTEWQRERGGCFNHGRVLTNNYSMQRACLKSGAFVTQAYHTFHTCSAAFPAPIEGESA
jgi:GNAT superfamily N-acetyltransferase